jgi:CRISPR-associated endonuclease/helicase Cas3
MHSESEAAPCGYLAHTGEGGRTQPLDEHLKETGRIAARFAASFEAESMGCAAGLLHDLGKYSQSFQRRILSLETSQRVDHSTAGSKVAAESLLMMPIAFAIAGHHAGIPDGGNRHDSPDASTLMGRLKRTPDRFDDWKEEIQLPAPQLPAFLQPQDKFGLAFFTRMLYSCLVDADFLDTETFMRGKATPRGGYESISSLCNKLDHALTLKFPAAKGSINEKRAQILSACQSAGDSAERGLYSLTVPTGGGKTIASLSFALRHAKARGMERIIYVIPYLSITEQNAEVFRDLLGEKNIIEHHSAANLHFEDGETPDLASYKKILAAENYGAPVVVTTAVSFFESLYANRSSKCRKLHNLANSVIIFDEAQTIPLPQLRPCVAAVAQLVKYYRATAVLCTATQPALEDEFACFMPLGTPIQEICPGTAALFDCFKRTQIQDAGVLTKDALIARLNSHQQVLCVVNTRKLAQELFDALQGDAFCLTTLTTPGDRRTMFGQIRQRLKDGLPCRVVSTSLIEAGVDLDFPAAYREMAGLDSIIQAAGRCNRNNVLFPALGQVCVFRLEGQKIPPMLAQNVAAAEHVMARFSDPACPEAIAAYFQFLRAVKGKAALDQFDILDAFERGIEGRVYPFSTVAQRFRLIDCATKTVYIPRSEADDLFAQLRSGSYSRTLFRKLGQYSVNVYENHYQALYEAGALEILGQDIAILRQSELYDQSKGLTLEPVSGNAFLL